MSAFVLARIVIPIAAPALLDGAVSPSRSSRLLPSPAFSHQRASRCFTLIELLIVVGIIGIVAAIALPNFLEAQTRSKAVRVRADMASISTALEAYAVDHSHYPRTQTFYEPVPTQRMAALTTPIAYLTSIPRDPFNRRTSVVDSILPPGEPRDLYWYNTGTADIGFVGGSNPHDVRQTQWSLTSAGPDSILDFPYYAFSPTFVQTGRHLVFIYDPTNGTVSSGEIFRRGGLIPYDIPGMPR